MKRAKVSSGASRNKPDGWKDDIAKSVDMYNDWFMKYAPTTYRETRIQTTKDVETTLKLTSNLTDVSPKLLRAQPDVLPTLRMSTCPPLAVDRLVGLAGVSDTLVGVMEKDKRIPARMGAALVDAHLAKIGTIVEKLADPDVFVWLGRKEPPTEAEIHRASTIIADRLCGSVANPIIRNAQEKRQLAALEAWAKDKGYQAVGAGVRFNEMVPGTYGIRMNVSVKLNGGLLINIPIDFVVMPKDAKKRQLPVLIEAKSAGDFTNVNKRRKEEATKMAQLHSTYGKKVSFALFLCGYFDSGYLGYEAAEGIDWVWEHRIDDLKYLGL